MRALLVSYAFPPVGGAGVQRVAKLTKYLPEHGIQPAVLSVDNPSVPLADQSLLKDVPAHVQIERARTLEPGYAFKRAAWRVEQGGEQSRLTTLRRRAARALRGLLLPDPQILWQPGAQVALARRLLRGADDLVFISGPPFSQFLLAPLARLRPGTAVVLDYRDEWSTYRNAYEMMGPLAARFGALIEPLLVERAHAITTATEAFRDELLARFAFLDPGRVIAIPNGYDPDDFTAPLPLPPPDRFVATYAGTVFRLTSARGLLSGIRLLHERSPALARRLEVQFIGRIVETERDAFADSQAFGIRQLGYVPHDCVLAELAKSQLTLCLLDEVDGAERIYPAKVFELMRLGRPCLVLSPPGALTQLVARHRAAEVVAPRDAPAIAAALERRLREFAAGRYSLQTHGRDVERYDRRRLAGEFAEVFRQARADARPPGLVSVGAPRANDQSATPARFSTTTLRTNRASRPSKAPSAASA
jgi:glycosyltransferase involved in cell wall biosynthesis